MKLTFSRYLVENEGESPNFASIKNNLNTCLEKQKFIYRGSDTEGTFGEKGKRIGRSSLTSSNLIMNLTTEYFSDVPNRKNSYFGTNNAVNAREFGQVFVIIPHDDVKEFAVVNNDFNLRDNSVFDRVKSGLGFSAFGYRLCSSTQFICEKLKRKKSTLPVVELHELLTKLSNTIDVERADFEKLDSLFNEVFSSGEPEKSKGYSSSEFANYVWDEVSASYDGSLLRFLKAALKESMDEVMIQSFPEALETFKQEDVFEVWFEGKCSYFSVDWLNKEYTEMMKETNKNNELANYEHYSIIYDASNDDEIDEAIALVFKRLLRK